MLEKIDLIKKLTRNLPQGHGRGGGEAGALQREFKDAGIPVILVLREWAQPARACRSTG